MVAIIGCVAFLMVCQYVKGEDGSPVVKWQPCSADKSLAYDACMQVKFVNGMEDLMVLNKYMGQDSILVGSFLGDPSVYVALSKQTEDDWDGSTFLASFNSQHEPRCGAFQVAADGKASCSNMKLDDITSGKQFFTDYIPAPLDGESTKVLPQDEESRALDARGYILNMRIYYDNNLVKTFGSEDEAEVRIKAVVAHAQTYFKMPSLTTTININLMSLKHLNMTWGASEENVEVLGKELETEPEANSYIFFGNDDGYDGPGFAPTKTTCSPTKSSRIAIVEYYTIDTATAGILAHELGHNLGMFHDFNSTSKIGRFASDGTACGEIGGMMSYEGTYRVWSKCSVEDFTDYHDSVVPFCLDIPMAPGSCFDWFPTLCVYNKKLNGCTGQLWNKQSCPKTCQLC